MIERVRLRITMINHDDKTRNRFILQRTAYYPFLLVFSMLGVKKIGVSGWLILIFHGFKIKEKWIFLSSLLRNLFFYIQKNEQNSDIPGKEKIKCKNKKTNKKTPKNQKTTKQKKTSTMQLTSLIITCLS